MSAYKGQDICSRHLTLCVTMAEEKPIYEIRFDAAVKVIQSLPRNGPFQPSNEMMLKFYSYYKQATQGPCTTPRPGFWDPVGKVKWDAWNSLGDMSKEKAMIAYVDEMKLILETIPVTEQVMELLGVLGPFYDVVENRVEEIKEACEEPDQTSEKEILTERLKVEESMVKSQVVLSNGNVEHSVSSLTNGTHSSLSSDFTEDDLQCILEPAVQLCDTNGPLSDHSEEVTGLLQLASDSDGEVYCDSMEQFGLEEGSVVLVNHSLETGEVTHPSSVAQGIPGEACRTDDPQGGDGGVQDGGEDWASGGPTAQRGRLSTGEHNTSLVRRGRGSRLSGSGSGVGPPVSLLGGGGDGERRGSEGGVEGTLNEQIATALARLQEDMQSVLQRLQTLEALTASQTRSLSLQQNYAPLPGTKKPPWWPFDVPPGAVAFAVVWPFVVHWLVWLYFQRRRRKMN
ncbi:acyl-CoA-binding domain-containing protein 5A-like isoform X3 [Anguilla anguilla]|uniref:acyl-CoA-binding domain-containing protein 5A-like isoform X3 n=1 Tax=Anguilla anguilla TaxID=7936 RepID=UPI0015AB5CF3|nr:acyl-CoA-binding domain-containing protein 5A-like isoform X3 [Anguilla anguilla]